MKDLARLEELREIGKRAKVEAKDMDLESLNSNMSKGLLGYIFKIRIVQLNVNDREPYNREKFSEIPK